MKTYLAVVLMVGTLGCSAHKPDYGEHEVRVTYFSDAYHDAGDYPESAAWCARVFKDGSEWRATIASARFGPDHIADHFFPSEEEAISWVKTTWCRPTAPPVPKGKP